MSTSNSLSMASKASSGSQTSSNTSQSNHAVSSQQRPQGLSASTKLIAQQLRQSERDLASQDRAHFFSGGLDWLMEQSIQVESSSGVVVRRRRGSLLTEKAVRVHNAGGRKCLVREYSNSSNSSDQSSEPSVAKVDSAAELRIDAWVSEQMHESSDPPQ
jgi:hypothetical protein